MGAFADLMAGKGVSVTSSSEPTQTKKKEKREPRVKLPKGVTPRKLMEEYYIPDELEREAIKSTAVRDIPHFIDVIDNMNRLGYAARSTVLEAIKSLKYRPDERYDVLSASKSLKKAFVKGFSREKKTSTEDILKELSPEYVQEAKNVKLPEIEIWGIDKTFKPDLLDLITFGGDTVTDPLTWIPFGTATSLAKKSFSKTGQAAKKMADMVGVGKQVEAALEKGSNLWAKKFQPRFDLRASFKRVGLEDAFDETVKAIEASPSIREKDIGAVIKTGKKTGILNRIFGDSYKKATLGESKLRGQALYKAEDEITELLGERMAQRLGMTVDEYFTFNKTKRILEDAIEDGATTLPKDVIDYVSKTVANYQEGGIAAIKELLNRKKGILRVANKMAQYEKEAALALRGYHRDVAKSTFKAAIDKNILELSEIKKAMKGDLKLSYGLLKSDIKNAFATLKSTQDDFTKIINSQAAPDMIDAVKAKIGVLKTNLRNLTTEGVDKTKGLMKNADDISQRKLNSLIKQLERDVGSAQIFTLGKTKQQIVGEMNKVFDGISRELRNIGTARKMDLQTLLRSSKTYKDSEQRILSMFNTRVETLAREKAQLIRAMSKIDKDFAVVATKAPMQAKLQARSWARALNSIDMGEIYHSTVNELRSTAQQIAKKHIEQLPKELQEGAWKARELLDQQAVKLSENGQKTIPLLYAPRTISVEAVEEYTQQLAKYRTKVGSLKPRKFAKYEDFSAHMAKKGVKVEEDFDLLVLDNLIKQDIAIAKKGFREQAIAKFGSYSEVPLEIKKSIDFFMNPPRGLFHAIPGYGKALSTLKFMLTAANPKFYARNTLGMPSQIATGAGIAQAMNPRNFIDHLTARFRPDMKIKTKFGEFTMKEIQKEADKFGYFATSQMKGDVRKSAGMILGRYGKMNPMRYIGQVFNFASGVEDMGRNAALLANLRSGDILEKAVQETGKGMTKENILNVAMQRAKDSMFDYNLINSPADKAIDGILGFYTFTRRNFPRQFMNLINDPKQYSLLSRTLNKVSNREEIDDEEMEALNQYDKETISIFGTMVDGIREFTALGFTMPEDAYKTFNAVTSGDLKEMFSGRISPGISWALDAWYGEDSFSGGELRPTLPEKYTAVIPEEVKETLGLTLIEKPKMQNGEVVGTEEVLTGKPSTVFMLQKFPLWSRIFGDAATLISAVKKGETGEGVFNTFSGMRKSRYDVSAKKAGLERKKSSAMDKAMQARGAKKFDLTYMPTEDKKKALERLRSK